MIHTQPASSHPFPVQLNRRFKHLFSSCLAISIALHLVILAGVFSPNSTSRPEVAVNYINIMDIVAPSPQVTPAMSPSIQPPEQHELVKPQTVVANDAVVNDSKDSAINKPTDILSSPLGLGMANGYFSSLAEGRTLRDDIRGYYFDILEKINHKWWIKAGTLKEVAKQDAIAELLISRDGELIDVRQLRSSGSREVDRALIEAISETAPFPPLPASYERGVFQAPLKISRPSHMFGGSNLK